MTSFNPATRLLEIIDELELHVFGKRVTEKRELLAGYYQMEFQDICNDLPGFEEVIFPEIKTKKKN